MLVGDLIRSTASRFPDKIGPVFRDTEYTWSEYNRRVNRLANGLIALGLRKGDRIAILARNSNSYLEFYGAVAKAGLVGVPINTWLKELEISSILANAEPRALVVDAPFEGVARAAGAGLPEYAIGLGEGHGFPHDLGHLMDAPDREPDVSLVPDDLFVLAYTSGTTGLPKGVMLSHHNSYFGATSHAMGMSLRPHHVFLMHAPMFFLASCANRFNAVLAGCRTVITTSDPDDMVEAIRRHRVTHMTMSPTVLRRLLDHPDIDKYDLKSVEMLAGTSAPFSTGLIDRAVGRFGFVWNSIYGSSETSTGTWLLREECRENPERFASVGRTAPFCELGVFDGQGSPIRPDGVEVGEIAIRGPTVTSGYWRNPDLTAEAFRDGWFLTGDMATRDADGFLYLVERKKDVIISGGVNIYPSEIESLLRTHPAVAECVVIGLADDQWGEAPNAVVQLHAGANASGEELIAFCKDRLASYKKPKDVRFVSDFPRTAVGKIRKTDLRVLFGSR